MLNKPNRNRLIKKIIHLVGKNGELLEKDLMKEVIKVYQNISESVVNSTVEAIILELEESGICQIQNGGRITLTETGLGEYKSILVRKEFKQQRQTKKIAANQKRQEIQQKKASSRDIHEESKLQLGELSRLLGKTWKQEHELVKGGPVRLDIIWYSNNDQITHAFEVQHRGEWKNAIGNLEAVKRRYPKCQLYLVVHNEKQISSIQQLLGAQLNVSIKVLKVAQVKDWLNVLRRTPENIRTRLVETVDGVISAGLI